MKEMLYNSCYNSAASIELCDEERTHCEVWTRVMGYHRPVSAFNAGKQSEHKERLYFRENPTGIHIQRYTRSAA